ncbi:hypothetical protein Vretifemale_7502 [Volvox reticuliferus]|nr:hypothetical protein Vretifemale_7502 [Volvox reticuliferus]
MSNSNVTCKWTWLSCKSGHIISVNLGCGTRTSRSCVANLQGAFPAEGPLLLELQELDVSGNTGLTGQLSLSGWRMLPVLQYLGLGGCDFEGTLPDTWTAVSSLTILDLTGNRFSGTLPPGLDALGSLEVLLLGDNEDLSGSLPDSWEKLVNLKVLDVRNICRLCGSTSMFLQKRLNGFNAYTIGSHVDTSCKIDECSSVWRGLHNVLQGVMAAFASVLGLIAVILIIRRVRHCTAARAMARDAARSTNGGGSSNTYGAAAAVGGSSSSTGDRGNATRSQRRARRRRLCYTGPARPVPLYTVEFESDGGVKWSVELVGGPTAAAAAVAAVPGGSGVNSATWSPSQRRQSAGQPPGAGEEREEDVELGLGLGSGGEREGDQGEGHQTSEQQGDGSARGRQLVGQMQTAAGGGGRSNHVASSSAGAVEMAAAPAALRREGGRGGANGVSAAEVEANRTMQQQQLVDPTSSSISTTTAAITADATSNPALTPESASRKTLACSNKPLPLPLPADAVILMPDEEVACLGRRVLLEKVSPPKQAEPAAPAAMAEVQDVVIQMADGAGGGLESAAAPGTGTAAAVQEVGPQTLPLPGRAATESPCCVL